MALEFPQDKESYKGLVNFTVLDDKDNPTGSTCTLYLPQGVQIADKVEYENVNLGMTGAAVEAGLSENEIASYIEQAGMGDIMGQMVANITKKFDNGAAAALRADVRKSPNPNTRALFKQVSLRSFAFTFKLIPVNESEASNIPDIIKFFRQELYPEEVLGGSVSLGYKFPNKFRIEMQYDGKEVGTKLQACYLEAFQTNYNPSGQAMHNDGKFAEIDINMNFLEGKGLNRKDIESGGF